MGTSGQLMRRAGSAVLLTAGLFAAAAAPAAAAPPSAENTSAEGCPPGMTRMMQQMRQNPDGVQVMQADSKQDMMR